MEHFSGKGFENIELRVGSIIAVDNFTQARKPSDRLKVSFGDFGTNRSGAPIRDPYRKDYPLGKPTGVGKFSCKTSVEVFLRGFDDRLFSTS
jgi:tRNA-binding protein